MDIERMREALKDIRREDYKSNGIYYYNGAELHIKCVNCKHYVNNICEEGLYLPEENRANPPTGFNCIFFKNNFSNDA